MGSRPNWVVLYWVSNFPLSVFISEKQGFGLDGYFPNVLDLKEAYRVLLLLSHFSHVQPRDPIDSSPPGSAIPGILQARTLE